MRCLLFALALAFPFPAAAAVVQVDLQPVSVCTEAGCARPSFRKRYLKRIWAQVGIGINILSPISSDVLDIATDAHGELDATDALYDFAFWHMDESGRAGTAYMGFTAPLAGRTLGMAFVNEPSLTLFPYGIAESLGGRYGAAVVAHELGHILGAHHDSGTSLMSPVLTRSDYDDPYFLPAIDSEIFRTIRDSPLLTSRQALAVPVAIPLPSAAPALLGALVLLVWTTRSKRRGTRGTI